MSEKHQAKISFQSDAETVPLWMDAAQIKQVLLNLIENAIESSAKTIHLSLESDMDLCRLGIVDDGVGMTTEVVDHIFEPFFTTRDVGDGTGLGLSIAYGIVSEHGGTIDVQSNVGTGSQFMITIPRSSSAQAHASTHTSAEESVQ